MRRADGLKKVLEFIAEQAPASYAERNALLVGRILATAALTREESRGTHYREDFPDTDAGAKNRIIIRRGSERRTKSSAARRLKRRLELKAIRETDDWRCLMPSSAVKKAAKWYQHTRSDIA